jgi:hypothetical protein
LWKFQKLLHWEAFKVRIAYLRFTLKAMGITLWLFRVLGPELK